MYADGILISNLLGNGATFTPRWGLVTPEEIERVDVLYGPFSAAYPGNSVGAVVDYVTRMPDELEMHVRFGSFGQDFEIYDSSGRFTGWQASASAGDRSGKFSWWLNFNRLDSDGQPLSFANKLVSIGARRWRRHARDRCACRSQPAQPGLADTGIDHADRHGAGSCEGQTQLRLFADAARQLHTGRMAQRCGA